MRDERRGVHASIRAGIPRFAGKLRRGEPVTVVAFGTSMTMFGQYLSALPDALRALSPSGDVRFLNRGFRGYVTVNAPFRAADAVAAEAPDLVLIEFAHNDVTPGAIGAIFSALHGVLGQIWAARPECEFIFVYLAQPGQARGGPSEAMKRYEEIADHLGIASIDVATFVEALVERGEVDWRGGERALTYDGIHYTDLAQAYLGRPFAAAVSRIIDGSRGPAREWLPTLDASFAQTELRPAREVIGSGQWAIGEPTGHDLRNADGYRDGTVLQSVVPGATLSFAFEACHVGMWAAGVGIIDLEVIFSGQSPQRLYHEFADPTGWQPYVFLNGPVMVPGMVTVTVRSGTVLFGDVFVAGRFR